MIFHFLSFSFHQILLLILFIKNCTLKFAIIITIPNRDMATQCNATEREIKIPHQAGCIHFLGASFFILRGQFLSNKLRNKMSK